ncbi:YhcH/YjgK/YiaL family protein [Flavobacterium agrisoli]|uniref:YhcH/YjgK/YiaL family protein n=1 Tax=Flavobacterium agrisoli TaxID=2793066 RepID=A0A934UJ14_9FLAO|nr:YhcH/YjgK/YiaL family protein [Flavobacterium agrisoli]MBK0369134.1 YhcH/YjgK/YiaL family protein [Flavobacterium agrisoli]
MIIDFIENSARYEGLHPSFKIAFDRLKQQDKAALDGWVDEENGVKMFGFKGESKTKEKALETFECHDKNIDIQFCISGKEGFLWKPRANCSIANGDYNTEKDVRFFNDAPDTYFELQANQFVIFFPEDVHAPMIGDAELNKIVVKVLI